MIKDSARRQVIIWLSTGCVLIFLMVVIGGITRLTGSGLSMTDWQLISGSVPPTTEEAWQASFEAYKQFPQFEIQPYNFSLRDYQRIFWWEYIHRTLGRVIGLVFVIPFIFFLLKRIIGGTFVWKLLFLLVLGAFQGFLGWYMVKSGLAEDPHVSHYRLAIHLMAAFITFSYTFWLILEIVFPYKQKEGSQKIKNLTVVFLTLLFIQITYGAFTAGLKAGFFYTTFPKMGDQWIAEGMMAITPFYKNFTEGIAGVQFIHRYLGIILLIYSIYFYLQGRKTENFLIRNASQNVIIVVFVQVLLGIFTLIFAIPLSLALTHQIGAFFLLMTLVYSLRVSKYQI